MGSHESTVGGIPDGRMFREISLIREIPDYGTDTNNECANRMAVLSVITLELPDEEWLRYSEDLRSIGYRIADEPPDDLIEEVRLIPQNVTLLISGSLEATK